jgi:ADP-ribose pyrophosphatase
MDFRKIDEELIYEGRVFDLVRSRFSLSDGKEHNFDLVRHAGAVVIVPVDELGRLWFVRQFRIGAEQTLLELPAGLLEEGESVEDCATREVQEEIGMAPGKLEALGSFYMVPGYSTEKMHAFLATGLYDAPLPGDEDEYIERQALPVGEVFRMVRAGEIQDGKTLAALFMAQPQLEKLVDKG